MINKIEDVLDQYVRPQLSEHYGNVKIISFNDGILEISLTGQCGSCPSAKFTVESLIEQEVRNHVPEVEQVVLINEISDDLINFAKKILNKEL